MKPDAKNAKTHPGATLNTDYSLLYCTMRIRLRNLKKGKRVIKFNVEALKNLVLKMQYQLKVSNCFEQLKITSMEEDEPQNIWPALARSITEAAENTIGRKKRNRRKINGKVMRNLFN